MKVLICGDEDGEINHKHVSRCLGKLIEKKINPSHGTTYRIEGKKIDEIVVGDDLGVSMHASIWAKDRKIYCYEMRSRETDKLDSDAKKINHLKAGDCVIVIWSGKHAKISRIIDMANRQKRKTYIFLRDRFGDFKLQKKYKKESYNLFDMIDDD